MATIYVVIKDEADNGIGIDIDAEESVPQDPQEWSPAQILGSHLHDYIICLQQGMSAEQARKLRHH
ncbi:MAG TPA: hypothetical protein VFL97_00830 [Nitrococcus sp.]|nr:hypothetical protein [Nitrococcus sp.]